jgi:hypothetical protein
MERICVSLQTIAHGAPAAKNKFNPHDVNQSKRES